MPAGTPGTASAAGERAATRLAAIDPLLPAPAVPAGCGAELAVSGPDGSTAALGTCEHWAGEPGSLDLTWGAVRRFQLTPQVAGPDVAGALDECWPGGAIIWLPCPRRQEDTAAVITWPARDIDGPRPLLRHGLAPRAVIAARAAGRPGCDPGARGTRRADPPGRPGGPG